MAYDLTKLVKVSALQQLAQKIKDLFYDKTETDTKLEDYVKTITVGQQILEPTNQNIVIPTIPSGGTISISVNNDVIQPDANGEIALEFSAGSTPNTFIVNNHTITIPTNQNTDQTNWIVQ